MKHTAAILLLVLLLHQTGGYYVIFSIDLLEAKRDAMSFIRSQCGESEDMTTLTFPVRDGKIMASGLIFNDEYEFTYQGKMYDVISSVKGENEITFRCYSDDKETALTQNLSDKIDSDKDAPVQKQKGVSLLKIFLQYTSVADKQLFFYPHTSISYSVAYQNLLQSFIYWTIISPPPEAIA